ncbi:M1 family peptidase [Nocardia sp. SYP-A9097]|uniref:M1 family metallopeptidase n=1 Tax=Nocardia sp. SYP-A9097 TaxID=2663237 RepID=UPI00129A5D4A|nr:M1 family metallopeptidase [Nocardia sp. SYP-A9097]MRH91430.1 M1 family peptidase [Nocardia sp. SYP-A9097]
MRHSWWRYTVVGAALLAVTNTVPAQADPGDPFAGAPGLGDPYYPLDGNGGYDAENYDVTLGYDPASHVITGSTRVDAVATQALHTFDLDYSGPQISKVSVNNLPAWFTRTQEHELVVTPMLPLLPGLPFTVQVEYAGEITGTDGEGWILSPSGGAFVAGEPHSASAWYPLNDTPLDKATFALHATVPAEWEVMSNGLKIRDELHGANRTVDWEMRQPVVGYLTTIAIDKFEFLAQQRADGTPLLSAFAPQAEKARAVETRLPEFLDFLETLYGPYPFDTAGGIYVDTDLQFSLETQSRPIYAPWTDLDTVVHELTHQWWGDSMSVKQWSDICLNECFASYTADYLWPERMEGKDVDAQYREAVAKYRDDAKFWQITLQNPGVGNEFTSVYYRGPLFLHALRRTMGDAAFFGAVHDFVDGHRYGNASMPEFRQFMQSRTPTDLTGFFAAWLDHAEPPADEFLYPGSLRS